MKSYTHVQLYTLPHSPHSMFWLLLYLSFVVCYLPSWKLSAKKVSSSSVVWSNCFRWMLTVSSSTRGHSVGVLSTCLTYWSSLSRSSLLTWSKCRLPSLAPNHPLQQLASFVSLIRLALTHTCVPAFDCLDGGKANIILLHNSNFGLYLFFSIFFVTD